MRRRSSDARGIPRRLPGTDAGERVLEHDTLAGRESEALGAPQVDLRVGLALRDVLRRQDRVEVRCGGGEGRRVRRAAIPKSSRSCSPRNAVTARGADVQSASLSPDALRSRTTSSAPGRRCGTCAGRESVRVRKTHLVAQVRRPPRAELLGAEPPGEPLVRDDDGGPRRRPQPEEAPLEAPLARPCTRGGGA